MPFITISPCTVHEFFQSPNLAELFDEYARESSIAGLGECVVNREHYEQLEAAGIFHALTAHQGEELVGFVTLLVTVLPHYGRLVAATESFFVKDDARAGGTGLKLLRAAGDLARDKGAIGLLVSAPYGGRLAKILPRLGYEPTNQAFFRGLQ